MKTKKFLSLVLSAAMILGVAVPVAARTGVSQGKALKQNNSQL